MRILCLQHIDYAGPGILPTYADEHGHSFEVFPVWEVDTFPDIYSFDFLIILGGPFSVNDLERFAWMQREVDFIQRAIECKKLIFGISFGSQLLSKILGADVYPIRTREIGWFPIKLEKDFYESVAVPRDKNHLNVMHWHGEAFTLPEGARLLAHNTLTRNQWFLWENHVMGIQFHLEHTPESTQQMIDHRFLEFTPENRTDFVQTPYKILSQRRLFAYSNRFLYLILDWYTAQAV